MFELDDELKILRNVVVIKEMFLAATLVKWTNKQTTQILLASPILN